MKNFKNKKLSTLIFLTFCIWVIANIGYRIWMLVNYAYFTSDDTFYYFLTAINYVKYGFYTFDTISATNGFHPLLMWLEIILVYIVGEDVDRHKLYYALLLFIGSSITLSTIYQAWYLLKKQSQYFFPYILTFSFLLSVMLHYFFNGLEPFLILIFTPFLILFLLKEKFFIASIIGALIVMSRLDTIIYLLPPLYLLACFPILKKQQYIYSLKKFILLLLPSVVFVLLYMIYNYSIFGYFKPISGELKSTFPFPNPQFGFLFSKQTKVLLFAILLAIIMFLFNKNTHPKQSTIFWGLISVTFMYILNFMLFQKWVNFTPLYYWGTPFLIAFLALAISVVNFFDLSKTRLITVTMLLLIIIGYSTNTVYRHNTGFFYEDNISKNILSFLKENIDDDVLAYTDCGSISFYSGKSVINLDGLINNFEYQSFLKNKQLKQYLKNKKVRYLMTDFLTGSHNNLTRAYGNFKNNVVDGTYSKTPFFLYSYMYEQYSDTLYLHKEAEVFRIAENKIFSEKNKAFIIYDLHKTSVYQNDYD